MKTIVERLYIQDIPLLHLYHENNGNDTLPFVIFVHGYTSAKEHNLHYAYLLAEKGFRVALPDVKFHGERTEPLTEIELSMKFWEIVLHTIKELNDIKNYFVQKNLVDPNNIGVAGTSMGGIITLGAITQYSWIKTAVSLMGCPHYQSFAKQQVQKLKDEGMNFPISDEMIKKQIDHLYDYDLTQHKDALQNRPILFWHGKKDHVVPFLPTYQFYQEIKPLYQTNKDHLKFIAEENAGHKVSRQGVLEAVNWLEKHLQQNIRNAVKTSL